jgi:hypothetical protein
MLKRRLPLLLFLSYAAAAATGQGAHTPDPGSAERQGILDVARVQVAADLPYEGAILFRVDHLSVYDGWALLEARPLTPAGTPIHKQCIGADEHTLVLLRLENGKWQVVRGGTTCATDVYWLGWKDELGAPAEIFVFED